MLKEVIKNSIEGSPTVKQNPKFDRSSAKKPVKVYVEVGRLLRNLLFVIDSFVLVNEKKF